MVTASADAARVAIATTTTNPTHPDRRTIDTSKPVPTLRSARLVRQAFLESLGQLLRDRNVRQGLMGYPDPLVERPAPGGIPNAGHERDGSDRRVGHIGLSARSSAEKSRSGSGGGLARCQRTDARTASSGSECSHPRRSAAFAEETNRCCRMLAVSSMSAGSAVSRTCTSSASEPAALRISPAHPPPHHLDPSAKL